MEKRDAAEENGAKRKGSASEVIAYPASHVLLHTITIAVAPVNTASAIQCYNFIDIIPSTRHYTRST